MASHSASPYSITQHRVPEGVSIKEGGDILWKLRRLVMPRLPQNTVTRIAQTRARVLAARVGDKRGAM